MEYVVVDFEWNQSPYGKNTSNKRLPFEIIEIGAVKLDEELNKISSFDRLIRPEVYLKLHKAIEKMLPITMRDLQKGKSFTEAVYDFLQSPQYNPHRIWPGERCSFSEHLKSPRPHSDRHSYFRQDMSH